MNIDGSVYCDVEIIVGDDDYRGNEDREGSDVEGEVGIGYVEWFELEVGYEVGSSDDRSVNRGVKSVKGGVHAGVGGSEGWSVCIFIVDRIGSDDVIKFGINYGFDIVSSDG